MANKAKFRWKKVATFKIHIEYCATGQCWRAVCPAGKTNTKPIEDMTPAVLDIGTGKKYHIRAFIRRLPETSDFNTWQEPIN